MAERSETPEVVEADIPETAKGLPSDAPEVVEAAAEVAKVIRDAVHLHAQIEDPRRPEKLHAYRYIHGRDGTSLAVWATEDDISDEGGVTLHLTAFDTIGEASLWSPRDEYAPRPVADVPPAIEPPPADVPEFKIAG